MGTDGTRVLAGVSSRSSDVSDDVRFEYDLVSAPSSPGVVSKHVRKAAREHDAEIRFVGGENSGRIVVPVTSVGAHGATDRGFDVFVARYAEGSRR